MRSRLLLAALAALAAAGPAPAPTFLAPPPDHRWSFPADHRAHPGYRNEWWYFTGTLEAEGEPARRLGFQVTFFRVGLAPSAPALASAWAASDAVMVHVAVTDVAGGTHRFSEVLWRAVPSYLFDESVHGFRVSTTAENYDNLARIRALIRDVKPTAPIIFTLSPVPLMATFRPVSCVTASSVSKAILRVSIDELMRTFSADDRLLYFPSYEIVKDCVVDPYLDDNRHPKPEVVSFVMETFERHYCLAS
jgi:hypothetical protein